MSSYSGIDTIVHSLRSSTTQAFVGPSELFFNYYNIFRLKAFGFWI